MMILSSSLKLLYALTTDIQKLTVLSTLHKKKTVYCILFVWKHEQMVLWISPRPIFQKYFSYWGANALGRKC